MFENAFKIELGNSTSDSSLIDKLWSEIQANYIRSTRFYHNLAHLDNLVKELLPIKNQIEDWRILTFSVAYHDIIYNTLRQDNEERSAELAHDRLTQLAFSSIQTEKCKQQILSTKYHELNENADTNYFIDADLSILGSDQESYLTYTQQIRSEYRHFPDILYYPGRKKVLERFVKMKNIFKTEYFQSKYEKQAGINILDELKSLF